MRELVKLITGTGNDREYNCNGLLKAKIMYSKSRNGDDQDAFPSICGCSLLRLGSPLLVLISGSEEQNNRPQTVDDVNRNL